ncbi:SnoK [Iodidimonas muriae]|uniref:SnoK n=1 Tax=Iodidimonas muriae TaxID=261467 RepID=A0ABQ2LG95_9PROT|nr:phytanoyl-CoA dioxygenase family protein [Iodidimonas muriae]GER08744.1 SnoK [Kordiimonadales bacterium JCM 17843]GGO16473.1 SnoK [Iodidimonas muriae]
MPELTVDPRAYGFEWQNKPTNDLRIASPAQIAQFNQDGYFLLEKAISPQWIEKLLAQIDPIEAGITDTTLTLEGDRSFTYKADAITFVRNLVAHSDMVRDLVKSPVFRGLGHDLIGPDVRLYWDQAVYKKPEKARTFPWHQDNGYTLTDPQAYLTCWLALTDATLENGCPWVLPGLHKHGTLIHDSTPDGIQLRGATAPLMEKTAVCVPAKAGDMVVFSSLTPHKTGANTTSSIRKALIIQLMPDGLAFIKEDGTRSIKNDPVLNMPILSHGAAC